MGNVDKLIYAATHATIGILMFTTIVMICTHVRPLVTPRFAGVTLGELVIAVCTLVTFATLAH